MASEFINVEDHGEWLNFRMRVDGLENSVPVKVSREAMTDHFGAGDGPEALAQAYVRHSAKIEERARAKMKPGVTYTPLTPLEMRTADF